MKIVVKLLKNVPLQLLICLLFSLTIGHYLPKVAVEYAYTVSTVLTDILKHLLPFLVFSYIAFSLSSFHARSLFLIIFIILGIFLSNALTVLTGYAASLVALPYFITASNTVATIASANSLPINSLWELPLKPFIPLNISMMAGAIFGIALGCFPISWLKKIILHLRELTTALFKKGFIPLLPLYILGFLLKIAKQNLLWPIIQSYTGVLLFSWLVLLLYLGSLYMVAAKGKITLFKEYLKQMLPATITGFSTVSSAVTIPVTIDATERNLKNRNFADFVIPITANPHLIGDGISISITAIALLLMHGLAVPNFASYLIFIFYYCLAKFSCAGVPGGGVLVLVPVFQQYLGMSPELATLLASIYILQDPILTAANVTGNGAFAIISHRLAKKTGLA